MEYLEHALQIVKAQAGVRQMTPEEMISMARRISQDLAGVGQENSAPQGGNGNSSTHPDAAIKERSVECLECGQKFKVLTKKHMAQHGLTPQEYRERWGYKKGTPLVAKGLARERRKKMTEMRLWEKRGKGKPDDAA